MSDKVWSGILALTIPDLSVQEAYLGLQRKLGYRSRKFPLIRMFLKNTETPGAQIVFPGQWFCFCFEGQEYPRFHIHVNMPNRPKECGLHDPLEMVIELHCDWQAHHMEKDEYGLKRCTAEMDRIHKTFGGRGSYDLKPKT